MEKELKKKKIILKIVLLFKGEYLNGKNFEFHKKGH